MVYINRKYVSMYENTFKTLYNTERYQKAKRKNRNINLILLWDCDQVTWNFVNFHIASSVK